jgi:hypothetical protein
MSETPRCGECGHDAHTGMECIGSDEIGPGHYACCDCGSPAAPFSPVVEPEGETPATREDLEASLLAQIEHTNYLRSEYQRRLARATERAERAEAALAEAAREINCAGPVAHRIRTLKAEWQSDVQLGAALRAALATVPQGHGLLVYPDNKIPRLLPSGEQPGTPTPFGAVVWDGLFRFNRNDATRALAALLRSSLSPKTQEAET